MKNFNTFWLVFAPIFVLLIPYGYAGQKSVLASQISFLRALERKGEIRQASCKQVLSAFLKDQGLPGIGETAGAQGIRGNVDRRGEGTDFPLLQDEVHLKKPDVVLRIKTSLDKAHGLWKMTLNREIRVKEVQGKNLVREKFKIQTTFNFSDDGTNSEDCQLKDIDFNSEAKKLKFSESAKYTAEKCIDLLDGDPKELRNYTAGMPKMNLSVIKKDCEMGVAYFSEVKKILTRAN